MAPNPMSSHGKLASIGLKIKIARAELGSQFRQGRCGLGGQCEGNGRIHDLGGASVAMNTAGEEGEGCVPGVSVQSRAKVRSDIEEPIVTTMTGSRAEAGRSRLPVRCVEESFNIRLPSEPLVKRVRQA